MKDEKAYSNINKNTGKHNRIIGYVDVLRNEVKSFVFAVLVWEKLFKEYEDCRKCSDGCLFEEGFLHAMTRNVFFERSCIILAKMWDLNTDSISFFKVRNALSSDFLEYLDSSERGVGAQNISNLNMAKEDHIKERNDFFSKMKVRIEKYEKEGEENERFKFIKKLRNKKLAHLDRREGDFSQNEVMEEDYFKDFMDDALFIIQGLSKYLTSDPFFMRMDESFLERMGIKTEVEFFQRIYGNSINGFQVPVQD